VSVLVAPSILAADLARLADEIARVEAAGADWLHVDVMDGHFVPNITMGLPVLAAIRNVTRLPLDVHLMIADPDRYLEMFVRSGASRVSVHVETCPHLHRTLTRLQELGARAGAAVNPATPVSALAEVAHLLDHILVMSVNPGFAGQAFIPGSLQKIEQARALLGSRYPAAGVEVDGGIDLTNAGAVVEAGASILVAGTAVFHAADAGEAVRNLRMAAVGS
jgi:ribulose-phosphate 3-epimerase